MTPTAESKALLSEESVTTMTAPQLTATPHRTRKGASHVYCYDCEKLIASICDPYWDMSKTKHMHERGTGHHTTYVVVAPD